MINEMIHGVAKLLEPENSFLILNTYSLGFSAMIIKNLLDEAFGSKAEKAQWGEIYLNATSGVLLPLGVFGRMEM
jgi:23S rRNA (cytosine1962-C5)-methyltransferase